HRNDYDVALAMFELAGDKEGYSQTFWQQRLSWFQNHFSLLANIVMISAIVFFLTRYVLKRFKIEIRWKFMKLSKYKLVDQLLHGLYILKHPLEGFGDLRYYRKGS